MLFSPRLLIPLIALAGNALAAWPNGPFTTSGRWVHDASGNVVTYAGVNWPGAADTMIPEGLQYASIASIVSKIKSLGMNVIRLTYAIEMIDNIYENGGTDVTLLASFTKALGSTNGTAVYAEVLKNNPSFSSTTTRLQVFDAIAAACAAEEIYVHLDNHVSTAEWCCSTTDGNAFWGDTYFSIANWTRGQIMANLMSMSLRNEPREPADDSSVDSATYNWEYWYTYVQEGASAINSNNPDVLIFLSGLSYDTYITPVVQGTAMTPGTGVFSLSSFQGASNKIVLELHNYANSATDCGSLTSSLYSDGFQALNASDPTTKTVAPVVMSEWGFLQDDTTWEGVYASCLASYLPAQQAGWMLWVLSGSYYIRSGTQDYDETWGLLTHDWSAWRSPSFIEGGLIPMVKASLGL